MRNVDQFARASKAWPILVECAARRSTIRYGELGDRLGIHVRPLRFVLGKIQDYCLHEGLPPLTILVVDAKGKHGTGFIAWDPNDVHSGFDRVYKEDWSGRPNPFLMDPPITERDLMRRLGDPTTAEDVLRLVRSRGVAQILFRELIRYAYGNTCAVSGSRIAEGLETAHIVPWSACKPSDRLNVRNGILLTVWHHRLFDRGIITIDTGHRLRVVNRPRCGQSEVDAALLWRLEGKRLNLPRRTEMWPDERLITERNLTIGYE